jgi:CubicO group peptidase (beta-lactamase class C family)
MRLFLWAEVLPVLALGLLALACAADLAAVTAVYGLEYVWRLIAWRYPSPHDHDRYPQRHIAASPQPVLFRNNPDGAAMVRAAFARVGRSEAPSDEAFEQFLTRTETTSLLVLRDGELLYESYFNGHRRDTVQTSHSMAKSITSLLVGAAIAENKLPSIDTPAQNVLPNIKGLRDSGVSLRNLLNMTSGFAMVDLRLLWPFSVPWTTYKLTNFAPDLQSFVAAVRPKNPPGSQFLYDGRNTMLLGVILEAATGGKHVADWLEQRLWQPMGAEYAASWSLDSRRCGFEKMSSGINARPIDFLKIGQLVLRGGILENRQRLLPEAWIEQATTPSPRVPGWEDADDMFYGLQWWGFTRANGPCDVFADGIFGQILLISPINGIVVLRTGHGEGGVQSWPRLLLALANALGPAPV